MRISRQLMYMNMAEVTAMRSSCFRGNVGALVVRENDILSHGYNGPPSGEDHCDSHCAALHVSGCKRSDHAEFNAITRACNKLNSTLERCDLYCTYSPCMLCAETIFASGIARIFYRYSYRDRTGLDNLLDGKKPVFRVLPSGVIISERSGLLVDAKELR